MTTDISQVTTAFHNLQVNTHSPTIFTLLDQYLTNRLLTAPPPSVSELLELLESSLDDLSELELLASICAITALQYKENQYTHFDTLVACCITIAPCISKRDINGLVTTPAHFNKIISLFQKNGSTKTLRTDNLSTVPTKPISKQIPRNQLAYKQSMELLCTFQN